MNLAVRDVRRHLPRFVGTAGGLGLLLTVVIAMQGIYAGMVDDATILTRAMRADLWVVCRDNRIKQTEPLPMTADLQIEVMPR